MCLCSVFFVLLLSFRFVILSCCLLFLRHVLLLVLSPSLFLISSSSFFLSSASSDNVDVPAALSAGDRLVGLVVKVSATRAEDPGFESRLRRHFSGSSHTSDLKIGTPVATLSGAWSYKVSTGTGRPDVSIL